MWKAEQQSCLSQVAEIFQESYLFERFGERQLGASVHRAEAGAQVTVCILSHSVGTAAISDSRISPLRSRGPCPCYIANMGMDSIDESKAGKVWCLGIFMTS